MKVISRWSQQSSHRLRNRLALSWLLVMALVVLWANAPWKNPAVPDNWVWVTCDVGQGDAHLIKTASDSAILLDTGDSYPQLANCLHWAGVKHVELIFITHEHRDHYGALPELLKHQPVHRVFTPPDFDLSLLGDLPPSTQHQALSVSDPQQPFPLDLGQHIQGSLLWPPTDSSRIPGEPGSSAKVNNSSLVLLLTLGTNRGKSFSLLATGDIEREVAVQLARASDVTVDVLKVPHHGSQGSGTDLLDSASPALALIPVGADNDYGHPHASIISHLEQAGTTIYRTDTSGHIALLTDASGMRVYTAR